MPDNADPKSSQGATVAPFLLSGSAVAPAEQEEGIDFRTYLRVFRQYKWRIFAFGLLFALGGLLLALRSTPVYRADVKLLAEPVESKVTNGSQWVSTALVWLFYETQKEIIQSRHIALQVVDSLDLVQRYRDQAAAGEPSQPRFFDLDWRLWLPEQWRPKPPAELSPEQERLDIADHLVAGLSVEISKDSEIILVSYDDPNARLAAEVVNAVAVAYRDFGLSSRMTTARQQTTFLNQQLQELRAKVSESEATLQAYQQREGLIDTDSRQKIVTAELAGLSEQLIAAQTKRSEAEVRYREVERLRSRKGSYDSLVAVLQNSLVAKLREKQSDLSRRVSELSGRYGEKHPKMIAARSELADANRSLEQAITKVVGSLKQEYQVALRQEHKIQALIDQRKSRIQDLRGKGFALAKLEREAENARKVYEEYRSRLSELDVTSDYDVSNVRVIDEATVPQAPFKPNKARIISGAGLLGLLFGAFLAFLRDRLDTTFKLLEHVEERLGQAGLGIVPYIRPKKADTVPERIAGHAPHSPFAESINHIRTGVLFSNIDHPPQLIMVTSATAAEGKTTLASNLAFSFSQLGRTLLLECDLRKPRLAECYGLPDPCGLTDLAVDPDRVQHCLARIDDAQDLYVLPAGSQLPNPLEFLSSESFGRLLQALQKRFAHIIVDAPPVLPVSDAIVLAHKMDGVVLAVKAESTTDRMAKEALKRLRAAHVRPLGMVLTLVNAKRMAEYGGHYYGDQSYYRHEYGYGYGYGQTTTDKGQEPRTAAS